MAMFIVRVLLRAKEAEHPDYRLLHERMAEQDLFQTIDADSGTYHLPHGEYRYIGEKDIVSLTNTVQEVADNVDDDNEVLVSEIVQWAAIGLKEKPLVPKKKLVLHARRGT